MKTTHVFLLSLVAVVLVVNTDASVLPPKDCGPICIKVCSDKYGVCHYYCQAFCEGNIEIPDDLVENPDLKVVPISMNFSHYDKNQDGLICIEEYAAAEEVSKEEIELLFLDENDDEDSCMSMEDFETIEAVKTEAMAKRLNKMAEKARRGSPDSDEPEGADLDD